MKNRIAALVLVIASCLIIGTSCQEELESVPGELVFEVSYEKFGREANSCEVALELRNAESIISADLALNDHCYVHLDTVDDSLVLTSIARHHDDIEREFWFEATAIIINRQRGYIKLYPFFNKVELSEEVFEATTQSGDSVHFIGVRFGKRSNGELVPIDASYVETLKRIPITVYSKARLDSLLRDPNATW